MADKIREALVVLEPSGARGSPKNTAAAVGTHGRVTQIASDRVLLVQADDTGINRIAALPGVSRVLTPDAAGDVSNLVGGLNESESLFARGWLMAQQPKTRAGEGRDWDAPGFEPPDLPRK